MNCSDDESMLYNLCSHFIRQKRNFSEAGHQRKHMYNSTSPFTDLEGLRFSAITNNPFDLLNYVPTREHLFLDEATLMGFERYVDSMFSDEDQNDFCYFKIIKNLSPETYDSIDTIIQKGKYHQKSATSTYTIPICLIPIIEFNVIEKYSDLYNVKSVNASLERSQMRYKLNTYFHALMTLLNCTEKEIVNILYNKRVLPSTNFQLICSQKELTIAYKRYISDTDTHKKLGAQLKMQEQNGIVKPKYGYSNSNLCGSLTTLFSTHPVYKEHQASLSSPTYFNDNGKGILTHAVRNNKRPYTENQKNQEHLPKKLLKDDVSSYYQQNDIVHQAIVMCMPEILTSKRNKKSRISDDFHEQLLEFELNNYGSEDLLAKALLLSAPEILDEIE